MCTQPDLIVLPGGGPGTKAFEESGAVAKLINRARKEGVYIGAICAATRYITSPASDLLCTTPDRPVNGGQSARKIRCRRRLEGKSYQSPECSGGSG